MNTRGQTVGQAMEARASQPPSIFDMVRQAKPDFASVLPSHVKPDTFTRIAVGTLKRNPDLLRAASTDPASLMHSLMEAARLGLEPGTDEYYLTPRSGKVLGIVGYQGEIELIYRAGAVSSVKAELVHTNDVFRYNPGEDDVPHHEVDWFADRGEVRGAYAYAIMLNGATSRTVIVGPDRIRRAMEASATAKSKHSPWTTDFGAMVLKTAVHDLAKWVPTSAEYRREQLRAVAEVQQQRTGTIRSEGGVTVDVDSGEVLVDGGDIDPQEIIDAELADEDLPDEGGVW